VVDLPNEDLVALAAAELRQVLGITASPLITRIVRWPRAMPQFELGYRGRLSAIAGQLSRHPGLFLAGSFVRGVGIPDCIVSGQTAAQHALAHLCPAASSLLDHSPGGDRSTPISP
jgi:oxygen-dependent protoporphyrinogen oxidase